MDIETIDDAIEVLRNSDTTFDNVTELAALYTVRNNFVASSPVDITEKELNDIAPYYQKYKEIKRRYQLNQTNEGEVIKGIKAVCKELTEFVETLYSGTDMNRERVCIRQMLEALNNKYK